MTDTASPPTGKPSIDDEAAGSEHFGYTRKLDRPVGRLAPFAIGLMAVCMLINLYGFRFATMVNNIGVSLEFVITVGATILVAIVAFSSPDNHQSVSVLFTGGTSDGSTPYVVAWLAASLGPFFGLIRVEASADIAEETVKARHVIPRTMFYALTASIVIEFGMYVVYVLAIKNAD